MTTSSPTTNRFNILSLSGGGFLGLYTVSVLEALEREAGVPLAQCFDLLAGTSVGGIIALGLAAEKSISEIKTAFERNGTTIFSDRPAPTNWVESMRDVARSLLRPRYQAEGLRDTIVQLIGEEARIGDLKHPVIVPAVNLTKGQPQIFKTPHHPDFRTDLRLKVVDVALATAAAPTYFPIAEIGDALFADGGLYANSPDLLALHEAEHFFGRQAASIGLLSVGTTTAQFSFSHTQGRNLGALGWMREQRLVNVIIAAQQHSVAFMMEHRLRERYLRLDALQSKEQERHLALDVATSDAQKTIRGLAEGTAQSFISDERLRSFLTARATQPEFFHSL